MKTENPYDLQQKGLKYDALKKRNDELATALKDILGLVISLDILGQFKGCEDEMTTEIIKSTEALKNNEND